MYKTDAQTIMNDLKLESYKNFLVYDYAPNLKMPKDGDLSMFHDPIYNGTSEERDLIYYQHFLKRNHHNLSNPSLHQLNTTSNQLAKTHSSFESLYITYDAIYSKAYKFL